MSDPMPEPRKTLTLEVGDNHFHLRLFAGQKERGPGLREASHAWLHEQLDRFLAAFEGPPP